MARIYGRRVPVCAAAGTWCGWVYPRCAAITEQETSLMVERAFTAWIPMNSGAKGPAISSASMFVPRFRSATTVGLRAPRDRCGEGVFTAELAAALAYSYSDRFVPRRQRAGRHQLHGVRKCDFKVAGFSKPATLGGPFELVVANGGARAYRLPNNIGDLVSTAGLFNLGERLFAGVRMEIRGCGRKCRAGLRWLVFGGTAIAGHLKAEPPPA